MSLSSISETAATGSWSNVTAATAYNLRFKTTASSTWTNVSNLVALQYAFINLDSCTQYEFQVQTVCGGQTAPWSASRHFQTSGCDACVNFTYCTSGGVVFSEEWISNVNLNTINNSTGPSTLGYSDQTGHSTILYREQTYPISLTPDFQSTVYDEYFTVWIDYTQDGDFNEPGEKVFDAGATSQTTVTGSITIPVNAPKGTTRMRVSMKWGTPSFPCEVFDYGEVEDYCVTIAGACEEPLTIWTSQVKPTSARLNWSAVAGAHHFKIRGRRVGVSTWVNISIPNGAPNFKDVFGLANNNTYEWQILSVCDANENDLSGWTVLTTFTTGCYQPDLNWTTSISSTGALLNWNMVSGAEGYEIKGRRIGTSAFTSLLVGNLVTSKQVFGLTPATTYEWFVRTICDQTNSVISDFTPFDTFSTGTARLAHESNILVNQVNVYPNPASNLLYIELPESFDESVVTIDLYDFSGGNLVSLQKTVGGIIQIVLDDLPSGMLELDINGEGISVSKKVVVVKE